METKYTTQPTAGKWNYKKSGFEITIGTEKTGNVKGEHDYTVCKIDDNSLQAEANAKIIAAAPELLESLDAMFSMLQEKKDKGKRMSNLEYEIYLTAYNAMKKATE